MENTISPRLCSFCTLKRYVRHDIEYMHTY